jgi:glutamate formiminotransferase/formiminotetrahydrofolate cyclodeaminase
MARDGNPASASDAGVGALCARAAIRGAWLNVLTNAGGIKDRQRVERVLAEGRRVEQDAAAREVAILDIVERKFA